MKLEDYENWDDERLRHTVNDCFEHAMDIQGDDRRVVLLEAEFYLREFYRRENHRANVERDRTEKNRWWVELGLELLIVILIGLEIFSSIQAYRQQSQDAAHELKAFGDMQVVLSQMQDTSRATADTMTALQTTTQAMAGSLQKELGLFYDVSLNVVFDAGPKQLKFINNGRTNIELWGMFRPGASPTILKEARIIPPGSGFMIDGAPAYDDMVAHFPKPNEGSIPFEVYLKNERHEEFVEHGWLGIHWSNDTAQITVEIVTIAPEHWTASPKALISKQALK